MVIAEYKVLVGFVVVCGEVGKTWEILEFEAENHKTQFLSQKFQPEIKYINHIFTHSLTPVAVTSSE